MRTRILPSLATAASWLLLSHALLALGCGNAADREPGATGTRTAGASPSEEATAAPTGEADPAAREHGECVAALAAGLPEALGDLIEDLGYREALDEACEAQRAVRDGHEAGCDGLTASALRAGCRRRLAVRHARPDACPRLLDMGRDPICLAWATRAPARCAATVGTQSLLCRAPFEGNVELCRELGAERAPCESAVTRFGPLLEPREARALPPVSGQLLVSFVADRAAPGSVNGQLEQPVELDLTRGVYVRRTDCVATLVLAPERHGISMRGVVVAPFLLNLGPLRESLRDETLEASAALRVGLRPVRGGPQPLTMPTDAETARLDAELATAEGEVQVLALDARRGGEVELAVDVRVPAEGGAYRLMGILHTYVRDIDPLAAGECQDANGLL